MHIGPAVQPNGIAKEGGRLPDGSGSHGLDVHSCFGSVPFPFCIIFAFSAIFTFPFAFSAGIFALAFSFAWLIDKRLCFSLAVICPDCIILGICTSTWSFATFRRGSQVMQRFSDIRKSGVSI